MTKLLFRDTYLREAEVTVTGVSGSGVQTDATIFYAQGGGQPGDAGRIEWDGGSAQIVNSIKADGAIAMVLGENDPVPPIGTKVRQILDWDQRFAHMRIHTALHLLSVVIPLPVTGGAITAQKERLDFDIPEAPDDKDALTDALNQIIDRDLPITEDWITDDQLAANPGLVKTMSVQPPTGAEHVRLIRIGAGDSQIDLQPCGGTHVEHTGEIWRARIGKIENKGRQNRRVHLFVDDA